MGAPTLQIMIISNKLKLAHIAALIFVLTLCIAKQSAVSAQTIDNTIPETNAAEMDFEDELAWLREENYINIATKSRVEVSKAPSMVTVITAEEIENMGARTLNEVLRLIPGFNTYKSSVLGTERYGARGQIITVGKIKMLLDGHTLNQPLSGSTFLFFDDLTLKNVKKIEVIRGPGSALYGGNAFLAVINIITKDGHDVDGVEVSSGFGSFDTQDYNILYGKDLYGIDVTGNVGFYNTNGYNGVLEDDSLTLQPFVNQFSLAPGRVDDSRNKLDLSAKLSYKDLVFKAKYQNKDTEPFASTLFTLTDDSSQELNYAMAELNYKYDIGDRLSIKPTVYYDQFDFVLMNETFPDGFIFPRDLDNDGDVEVFPEGREGSPIGTNRVLGSNAQFEYDITDNNNFILGFDYRWERQDNLQFRTNFDPVTGAPFDAPGLQNTTATNWNREVIRQIWAVYLQDHWDISDDIGFTFGVRHDHYSDFEGTTNPRIGITWQFLDKANLKLLYGQAFRPPNFQELYTTNNFSVIGNPDLEPETIRTYEIGMGYDITDNFNANINYFYNVVRNEIGFLQKESPSDPLVFDNIQDSNIQGIELELKANFGANNYVYGNYTYLDSESKGDPIPNVAKHKGNVGLNYEICKYLNSNIHAFFTGHRERDESDDRDENSGFALLDLTLTVKEFFKTMKVKASLYNLLDKEYTDFTPANTIPSDIPRPGRTFFVELGYEF